MTRRFFCLLLIIIMNSLTACTAQEKPRFEEEDKTMITKYYFPSEDETHEGTWLTWPHHYTYGKKYRDGIEEIWIKMAYSLHKGEKVYIIAYDEVEQARIINLLEKANVDMNQIDFVIAESDDVWSRDTGPMFVFDKKGVLTIADFSFDGWGDKMAYKNDDVIPVAVAKARDIPIVSIPQFVLEGGSVELDGKGTAMLCKSSVISKNRNPKMIMKQAEEYIALYLGATNFIWLTGVVGEDITDAHIDGMARFYDDKTLLTVSREDFLDMYEGIDPKDYDILLSAKNAKHESYKTLILPMTAKNVINLDYKGSYLNYYVGNNVVLVPVYGDANDALAVKELTKLYDDRNIIPIDVAALYKKGGMIHCVTQQQPKK